MPASCFDAGQAEVGDPEFAGVVDQQVGRLDVAVEDAVLVGVVEGLGGLDAEPGDGAEVFAGVEGGERGNGGCKARRCRAVGDAAGSGWGGVAPAISAIAVAGPSASCTATPHAAVPAELRRSSAPGSGLR